MPPAQVATGPTGSALIHFKSLNTMAAIIPPLSCSTLWVGFKLQSFSITSQTALGFIPALGFTILLGALGSVRTCTEMWGAVARTLSMRSVITDAPYIDGLLMDPDPPCTSMEKRSHALETPSKCRLAPFSGFVHSQNSD